MEKGLRKASTFRIDPVVKDGLVKLSSLLGQSLNQLANDALREYVVRRSLEVEDELESTLEELRAYRRSDPQFERAIAGFVEAEAAVTHDPAEGRVVTEIGPTESVVREYLSE